MKPGKPGRAKHPGSLQGWAAAAARGAGHPTLLLALLVLQGTPVARGNCGPPPRMNYSRPASDKHTGSFPVGSRVMYMCIDGAIKIPGRSETVECLPGARWSKLPEPCGRSCGAPTRLWFAALSKEDERTDFFPVGTNVSYVCRPGYENISESSPTSSCLENLTWSEPAELCRRRSCGHPGALPGGRMDALTDLLFGARVNVFCEEGYKLDGNHFIQCQLKGNDVAWSELPTCKLITCPSPPRISNGKHDGEGVEKFVYNSTVTYNCNSGFQLIGSGSIRCMSMDKTNGAWSGAAPECKEKRTSIKLGERSPPPKSSRGNGIQPAKKALTWEKLSFHKKSLQNTNSFSHSSFSRRPVSRSCSTSAFRFVLPLYKTQNYYLPWTRQGSVCIPKYMGISGILPQRGCFENIKQAKIASFCGTRSWAARRSWMWQKCCYNRFPIRCKGLFYP
ncbi:complement decay-accelerating factor-like [Phaenicophaeus curvirostris]|uniref:complement decay-accelerating factor-like n=1 Tax=Phaenicophaeus curvirostris TaxID=33595 RepID=UPI0037F0F0BF